MKISFWISAVVFYVVRVVFSNSVQVGTVLFTTTDLVKKCWSEDDKSLLRARFVMQDVLPDPDCIDFSKPEATAILLDYFHACYQIISISTYGKVQNFMYFALSDAVGGYLRAYILPWTRKAYYAGQIQYSDARRLFQFYDDIRLFLKTNGVGWSEPQKICYRKVHAKPLTITGGALDACDELYLIEKSKSHCINDPTMNCPDGQIQVKRNSKESFREDPESLRSHARLPSTHPPPRNATAPRHHANASRRRPRNSDGSPRRKNRCGKFCCKKKPSLDAKTVIVPLPVLDDYCCPHSIALPLRRQPLRSLHMRNSAFILEFYYVAVLKCFIAKGNTRADIRNFNSEFHAWLVSQVYPHLNDEDWYPAFGGVLRVLETIRKFGAESTARDPFLNDIGFMFAEGVPFDVTENPKLRGKDKVRQAVDTCRTFPTRHYVMTVVTMLMISIFIFCALVFYIHATRGGTFLRDDGSEVTGRSLERAARQWREREMRRESVSLRDERGSRLERGSRVERANTLEWESTTESESRKEREWKERRMKEEKPKEQRRERGNADEEEEESDRARRIDKFVDFQFLVRFFRKNNMLPREEPVYSCTLQRNSLWGGLLNNRKRESSVLAGGEEAQPALGGQGDVLPAAMDKPKTLKRPFMPAYLCELLSKSEEKRPRREGEGDVQTLWMKSPPRLQRNVFPTGADKSKGRFRCPPGDPNTSEEDFSKTSSNSCSLEDETKGSSTGKHSSTCCCSETCLHSNTTSTKYSSRTQGSTTESQSEGDDDDSYSSDSDY